MRTPRDSDPLTFSEIDDLQRQMDKIGDKIPSSLLPGEWQNVKRMLATIQAYREGWPVGQAVGLFNDRLPPRVRVDGIGYIDVSMEDDPEYQAFVADMAKHCRCSQHVCDGVLAGGLCDDIQDDDDGD